VNYFAGTRSELSTKGVTSVT